MIYLICIFVVGLPIVIAEFVIGRRTQLSPVGAFKLLAPNTNWKWGGVIGVASAFIILSFYGVVGGWTLRYTLFSLLGGFDSLSGSPELSGQIFSEFIGSSLQPIFWQLIFMSFCMGIIIKGVKSGIEGGAKIMMPLILIILGLLVFKGLSLEGGKEGLEFLCKIEKLKKSTLHL